MTSEDRQSLANATYKLERQADGLNEMARAFTLTGNDAMAKSLLNTAEIIMEQVRLFDRTIPTL